MATQALSTPTATARGSSSFCRHHDVNRHRFLSLRDHNTASSSSRPITSFLIHLDPIGFRARQLSKSKPKLAIPRAADSSTQPSTLPSTSTAGKTIVPDDQFSLAKVSFGVIGLGVGVSLLSYGFGAYFNILPGSEWSALMLTYGFPLAIIGMAFKYAELKPVPCLTYSDALQLRETSATPILAQVRNDVTRYRYGDEQHLDEALKRIFQYGQGGGIARRSAPTLQSIREEIYFSPALGHRRW